MKRLAPAIAAITSAVLLAPAAIPAAADPASGSSGSSASSGSSRGTAPWFGDLSSAFARTLSSAAVSGSSTGGSSASDSSSLGSSASSHSSGSGVGRAGTLTTNQPLPTEPGKMIARQRVGASHNERILYTSTNERGQIVPVSGAIYPARGTKASSTSANGTDASGTSANGTDASGTSANGTNTNGTNQSGDHENPPRKGTVVLAPGTRGMGDQCAPSAAKGMLVRVEGSSANVNYEAPIAQRLADEGYQVVVTDYIGLGTPGVHTYLNRIDQGHAVIDAARAAANPGEKVFFYGYSQGGGATAAAGELQPEYAPELNLVGVFAGAPPANPETMLTQGNPATLEPVTAMVIASYAYSYPEFRAAIGEHTSARADRYLAAVAAGCLAEAAGSSVPVDKLVPDAPSLSELALSDDRILRPLRLNRLGTVPVRAPILIAQSPQDNVVPYDQGKQLADDYLALGSPVTFLSIPLSDASSRAGLGHVAPAITYSGEVIRWMNDRFAE
mgnify:CR=1 FL=1